MLNSYVFHLFHFFLWGSLWTRWLIKVDGPGLGILIHLHTVNIDSSSASCLAHVGRLVHLSIISWILSIPIFDSSCRFRSEWDSRIEGGWVHHRLAWLLSLSWELRGVSLINYVRSLKFKICRRRPNLEGKHNVTVVVLGNRMSFNSV